MIVTGFDSTIANFDEKIEAGKSDEVKEWAREVKTGSACIGMLASAIGLVSIYAMAKLEENPLFLVPIATCTFVANEMAHYFRFATGVTEAANAKKPLDAKRLEAELKHTVMLRWMYNKELY